MVAKVTKGDVSVSLTLGDISPTQTPYLGGVGKQCWIAGASTLVYIKPEVAQQWIPVLQEIAELGK